MPLGIIVYTYTIKKSYVNFAKKMIFNSVVCIIPSIIYPLFSLITSCIGIIVFNPSTLRNTTHLHHTAALYNTYLHRVLWNKFSFSI